MTLCPQENVFQNSCRTVLLENKAKSCGSCGSEPAKGVRAFVEVQWAMGLCGEADNSAHHFAPALAMYELGVAFHRLQVWLRGVGVQMQKTEKAPQNAAAEEEADEEEFEAWESGQ